MKKLCLLVIALIFFTAIDTTAATAGFWIFQNKAEKEQGKIEKQEKQEIATYLRGIPETKAVPIWNLELANSIEELLYSRVYKVYAQNIEGSYVPGITFVFYDSMNALFKITTTQNPLHIKMPITVTYYEVYSSYTKVITCFLPNINRDLMTTTIAYNTLK